MSADRKKLIIEAATRSFSLFGYKATTMEQVAKLANVGKGTIYTFFKNKEELLDEIIYDLIADMKFSVESVLDRNKTFSENVHVALQQILTYRKEHQLTLKLYQEEKDFGTHAVIEVIDKMETAILHYLKDMIVTAIERKEIKKCDPSLAAFLMLRMYLSLVSDWEKYGKELNQEEITQMFDLFFLEGLSYTR